MTTGSSDLMGLLSQKMAYLNQKQALHAQNIASASTPDYKARELVPFTFTDALRQAATGMKITNPRHIIPASMAGVNAATTKVKAYSTNINGNTVDSEQEAMKVSQTGVEYQLITSIMKKFVGLMKISLKGSAN